MIKWVESLPVEVDKELIKGWLWADRVVTFATGLAGGLLIAFFVRRFVE